MRGIISTGTETGVGIQLAQAADKANARRMPAKTAAHQWFRSISMAKSRRSAVP